MAMTDWQEVVQGLHTGPHICFHGGQTCLGSVLLPGGES
jgi:hypothetical protein